MAYVPQTSIKKNAALHAPNGPIKKYDFKNFFPSLTQGAWVRYCTNHGFCDRAEAIILGRLLFRRPKGGHILRLSIGAPTSPLVSNILMYEFDKLISERVEKHEVTYSRYADDLTFSARRTGYLTSVDPILKRTLAEIASPRLKLNEKKSVTATKKYRREVTGLILTNDNKISIGREKKRQIRATLHHFLLGRLNIDEVVKLAGHMAFVKDVEPTFYTRMQAKYGPDTLEQLKNSVRGYKRPRNREK